MGEVKYVYNHNGTIPWQEKKEEDEEYFEMLSIMKLDRPGEYYECREKYKTLEEVKERLRDRASLYGYDNILKPNTHPSNYDMVSIKKVKQSELDLAEIIKEVQKEKYISMLNTRKTPIEILKPPIQENQVKKRCLELIMKEEK